MGRAGAAGPRGCRRTKMQQVVEKPGFRVTPSHNSGQALNPSPFVTLSEAKRSTASETEDPSPRAQSNLKFALSIRSRRAWSFRGASLADHGERHLEACSHAVECADQHADLIGTVRLHFFVNLPHADFDGLIGQIHERIEND